MKFCKIEVLKPDGEPRDLPGDFRRSRIVYGGRRAYYEWRHWKAKIALFTKPHIRRSFRYLLDEEKARDTNALGS